MTHQPYPKINRFLGAISISKKSGRRKNLRFTLGVCNLVTEKCPFLDGEFQPNGKLCNHQVGSFPKVEVKHLKNLKPPGSFGDCFLCFRCYSSVSRGNFAIPWVSWGPSHPFLHVYTCQHRSAIQAPGLSHITRRKVTSPNGIARWRKVTSHGGKSHHFATIPMAQRHSTENRKGTKSNRDIAHSEIFVDFRKKFASNTNGTACAI